jgi:hypothetical protein
MWHHRDGVPLWACSGLVECSKHFKVPGITLESLSAADLESRKRRAGRRKNAAPALKKTNPVHSRRLSKDLSASKGCCSKKGTETNKGRAA